MGVRWVVGWMALPTPEGAMVGRIRQLVPVPVVLALGALRVGASALTVRALALSPKAHSASRNTCTGTLRDGGFGQERIFAPGDLQSVELNNSRDTWSVYPNHNGQHYWKWSSYSGFLRGCSN